MTRLILVRHGLTDDNLLYRLSGWTDAPLNEIGRKQADCAAWQLEQMVQTGINIHAIYASPLQRTASTAEIIANRLRLPTILCEGLKEMNFGKYDGHSILQLYETNKSLVDRALEPGDDQFGWEGGETRPQFFHRFEKAVRSIAGNHPDETVVVVTHAGAIAYFIAGILGHPLSHWNSYHVANCSLTTVLFENERFQLLRFNETDHVPKERFAAQIEEARKYLEMI
ncbi:histidine phosphatase family protein [Effusibacillus dendaii]|uniref:Phosphoglycerate mutase n=1 Tax=Effusibacillus dendaii TaxID=2743772 RepID=A0A7I8D937_9BACL|nr:histidine phosphatase family protein [Effusibacillus dendaii]BCJ86634.1 phosphoglycerate mutase [Effusibacillus dendaii]